MGHLVIRALRLNEVAVRAEIRASLRNGRPTERLGQMILAIGWWKICSTFPRVPYHARQDGLSRYVASALVRWPRLTGYRPMSNLSTLAKWSMQMELRQHGRWRARNAASQED